MNKAYLLILTAMAAQFAGARETTNLRELVVTGYRPLKEIGVTKTDLDSAALKENIALSMADILSYNSSIFVKSHGRATLSTVSFRGTSPSHTQVTWNGMKINSPMLGMTDFSTIPAYFIDKATLLHGSSSIGSTGGGLGGLVSLQTAPESDTGFRAQYVQGVGSFKTFDEFLRLSYGSDKWQTSTRFVCSSSANDYKYINHDKKENIYDDNHQIIGQYHPVERNRSGAFRDIHVLQEVYYNTLQGDRLGLSVWYLDSDRELPMLTTDYGDESDFEDRQREQTWRAVASWNHAREKWSGVLRGGYTHTWMAYDYKREISPDNYATMTRSRTRTNTIFAEGSADFFLTERFCLSASIDAHQNFVVSKDKDIAQITGNHAVIGYDQARLELSGAVSAKWQVSRRVGLSAILRQEVCGTRVAAPIPAIFADVKVWRPANLVLKFSASGNHRFPTLNDLYFMPGGNPDLRDEKGYTYDAGVSFGIAKNSAILFEGSATWFDSYIDDWIMWLPTTKGFFSPRNVKKVHAYGIELKARTVWVPAQHWMLDLDGSFSWTPSVNVGEKMTENDLSQGKQLPYVPKVSSSLTGRLSYKTWGLLYKWCYYSQRYTMSSNESSISGHLPKYFMSNVTLEKNFRLRKLEMQAKLAVNNLFNEDYLSVLARPMPGINFEAFLSIKY